MNRLGHRHAGSASAAIALAACALTLAACGGATKTSGTGPGDASSPAAASSTSGPTASSTPSMAASSSQAGTDTRSRASAAPAVRGHSRHRVRRRPPAATDSGVQLPATYTVRPSGRLSPPEISAPGRTTIVLTVQDADRARHTVTLTTPGHPRLEVSHAAPGRLVLSHLANGSYRLTVDGRPAGRLVVGVTPGP